MQGKKNNKFLAVFKIFFKSLKSYFLYLNQTSKYMLLPIFGQILGIILIFISAYYYSINISNLMRFSFFQESSKNLLIGLFIVISPFLAIFLHSFYKYIIAFSSLNITFYTLKKNVKTVDFKANDRVIERKLFQYIILMTLISFLCIFPPLWIVLCLSFQVFALESDTNCFKAISRSLKLTTENIFYVILMLIMVFAVSYEFLPSLFVWSLEKISLTDFLITKTERYMQILPYDDWNGILSLFSMQIDSVTISKIIVEGILSFIIIGFTLPFRCACFTELYRLFDNEQIKKISKESEQIIKRASSKKRKT